VGYLCRSGGEAASRSPAAVSRRSGPACNDSAASMRWLCPRFAGYAWDRREFQDRTRPFPASEYRACGIVFPYISANSTAKDLPPTAAKAAVLRTVAFHRCGRMTVRFVRSIRTHQSKRSGRSTAGALRTPSDRSKIRNSRDMRGMDDEPSRRRCCASCRSSLRPEGTPGTTYAFRDSAAGHSCPSSILEQTLGIRVSPWHI